MPLFELLLLPLALAAVSVGTAEPAAFAAQSVSGTGRLRFRAPVERVFQMFTPLGEKAWAHGWDPQIVYPRDRDLAEGMIFTTADNGGTYWVITRLDPAQHTIVYANFAPGFTLNRIAVRCRTVAPNETEVSVFYSHTGLSERGNAFVDHMDAAAFAKKMHHWQQVIGKALANIAQGH